MSQRLRITGLPDIFGRDSGNEDENDEDEELEDEDSESDEDEEDEDDEETVESLKAKLAEAEEAREKAHRRMRRADRAKSKADNELAALKNGGQKELADAQARVAELEAKVAELSGTDTTAIIREEFRDSTEVKWHNPKLAFSLLDLNEVDVEDGKVDSASLKDAIKKLTTEHPYLVKTDDKPSDDEDGDESANTPKPRSGSPARSRSKSARDKQLAAVGAKYGIAPGSRI